MINNLTGLEDEIDPVTGLPVQKSVLPPNYNELAQAEALDQGPVEAPKIDVMEYIRNKYGDEARAKVQADSQLGWGDRASAALMAIGAGFQGKDSASAGNARMGQLMSQKRQGLEDFDKGRTNAMQEYAFGRDVKKAEREDTQHQIDNDIDSDKSNAFDEYLRGIGYKGPKMSFKQANEVSPGLAKAFEAKENREMREREFGERMKDRQLQREIMQGQKDILRQDKLEKEAKPSEKQVKEFTEFDNALDSIKSIRAQKPGQDTGPVSALQSTVAQFVGMDDSQKSAFKSEVQDQLAQYIKSISGGAVSDQERASLMQNIPKMSDNDETFNKKLDALEARLERNRKNHLTNITKMGKNVKEFERESSQSSKREIGRQRSPSTGKIKIKYDDGSEEIIDG